MTTAEAGIFGRDGRRWGLFLSGRQTYGPGPAVMTTCMSCGPDAAVRRKLAATQRRGNIGDDDADDL